MMALLGSRRPDTSTITNMFVRNKFVANMFRTARRWIVDEV